MNRSLRLPRCALPALFLAAVGCSSTGDDAPATTLGGPLVATSNITLRPEVRQIDAAAWDAVVLTFQDFIENGEIAIEGQTPFDVAFTDSDSDLDVVVPKT